MAAQGNAPGNDRCSARSHPLRARTDAEPRPAGHDDTLALTPLGAAFMAALRADGAHAGLLGDPFGEAPESGG